MDSTESVHSVGRNRIPQKQSSKEMRTAAKVDIMPFPKALNSTTKSFFNNVDVTDVATKTEKREKRATRGTYPILQTAKREQYVNNFYYYKHSN